jgi:transposase
VPGVRDADREGACFPRAHGGGVPVDGRRVVVSVRVRRLVCPVLGYPRQTFREQVPGLLERYQRRTTRLTGQLGAVVMELAGRAGARLAPRPRRRDLPLERAADADEAAAARRALPGAVQVSDRWHIWRNLCDKTRATVPPRVPRVLGVDDFALKRRHRYAGILTDAETGERVDVLADRNADTLERWLRQHPGVEIVCRDGSGADVTIRGNTAPTAPPGPGPGGAKG